MIMSIENIDTDKILFCDYIIVWNNETCTENLRQLMMAM